MDFCQEISARVFLMPFASANADIETLLMCQKLTKGKYNFT